jgi:hypothetical protein
MAVFNVIMSDELLEKLDKKRNDTPRSRFIVRLVEKELGIPEKERAKYL